MNDLPPEVSSAPGGSADPFAEWDGAYVVGALSPAERRTYENHLTTCATCRASVTDLAGMPGLLTSIAHEFGAVSDEDGGLVYTEQDRQAPKELLTRLLDGVARRRRRRRVTGVLGGLSVAAAAVVAVVLVPSVRHDSAPTPLAFVLDQAVPSPLHAQVKLVKRDWGTQLYLNCQYAHETPGSGSVPGSWVDPDGDKYALTVTDRSGRSEPIATWTADPGTTVDPVASTSLPIAQIASVQISASDGTVLLRHTS